jgi:Fur family ferric uptake transcriptional regulator
MTKNRILEACRAKGIRLTGQRCLIARVLSESHDHPDVAELHRRVSASNPTVSIATVYRTVNLLERQGIVERHAFGEGPARYERASRHHDHMIDVDTGNVIEFRSAEIERLQAEIAHELGYDLVTHRLELYVRRTERRNQEPGAPSSPKLKP